MSPTSRLHKLLTESRQMIQNLDSAFSSTQTTPEQVYLRPHIHVSTLVWRLLTYVSFTFNRACGNTFLTYKYSAKRVRASAERSAFESSSTKPGLGVMCNNNMGPNVPMIIFSFLFFQFPTNNDNISPDSVL